MKRIIALLLSLLLMAACFTGCNKDEKEAPAKKQPTEEKKEEVKTEEPISFEGKTLVVYTDLNEGDAAHTAYMQQVAKFEEKTGAEVDVLSFGENLASSLDGARGAGKTIDVFKLASIDELRYEIGNTLDLTAKVEGSDVVQSIYPAYLERVRLFSDDSMSIHALPTTADLSGVWYSTEVFAAAGITAVPATVEEFEAACDALITAGYKPLAIEKGQAEVNFAVHMERMLGKQTVENLTANGGWAANTDAVAACQKLLDWADKGYVSVVDWPWAWEGIGETSAMAYGSMEDVSKYEAMISPVVLDCFSYPADKGSTATWFDCGLLCVSSSAQEPELAWEFLRFMTTGEADQAISAAGGTVPLDRNNTGSANASMTKMLGSVTELCDHSKLLADVEYDEVVLNIYTGAYADGAEAAAALDALHQ